MDRIMEYQKRLLSVFLICFLCAGVFACGKETDTIKKIKDLEFTVISQDNIPEELLSTIMEKKEQPFKLTFEDQGFVYICIGYGAQSTGGYSISVNSLYETANAIYVDTNLIGPPATEKNSPVESYPFVVIKTEKIEKPVVFD